MGAGEPESSRIFDDHLTALVSEFHRILQVNLELTAENSLLKEGRYGTNTSAEPAANSQSIQGQSKLADISLEGGAKSLASGQTSHELERRNPDGRTLTAAVDCISNSSCPSDAFKDGASDDGTSDHDNIVPTTPSQHGQDEENPLANILTDASREAGALIMQQPTKDDCFTFCLDVVPAIVVVVNTIFLGFQSDGDSSNIVWQMFELGFVLFYTLEVVIKMYIFGWRLYLCGKDLLWNWFDVVCLFTMYVDLGINVAITIAGRTEGVDLSALALLKMFRVLRLARLVKALRYKLFQELKLIVLGVFSGLRVLSWAILLLVALVYTLGVACRMLIGDEHEEFQSVPAAMFTTFRCFTDGCSAYDGTPLQERLRKDYGALFMVFYICLTMLVTIGLFNLIMAVFIDNVMTSQHVRKQKELEDSALSTEVKIKQQLVHFISSDDSADDSQPASPKTLRQKSKILNDMLSGETCISRKRFLEWLTDPDFVGVLEDASIDLSNRVELFDILDADAGGQLSMNELVTGLMRLRGPVTKGDVIGMSLKVRYICHMIESIRDSVLSAPRAVVLDSAQPCKVLQGAVEDGWSI